MLPGVVFPRGAPQRRYTYRRAGMGDVQAKQIGQMAAQGAALTGTILAAAFPATIAAIMPVALVPVIGAAIVGLTTLGFAIADQFKGCGDTCIEASKIADQVGAYLQQNFDTYMGAPVHYRALQLAALNNFDTAWQALTQACSDPQLQAAGQRCISDRQKGACHYHTSPSGWSNGVYTPPGSDGSGSTCWNWFVGLRDPIANDPTVVPDPSAVSSGASSLLSSFGVNPSATIAGHPVSDWLLPAALVGGALLIA
jgi:hypothetical protein